ncbi:MAG: tRNA-dihydrouridine synthase, partial [Deltaproteobacteria bacterium]|nr:tRNA-dihydrouridine synthase [Deltaproteobacteria bacterium]
AAGIVKGSATLLLGNGDLQDMPDVYRRVRESQVDGVLIGQSTRGNPWVFAGKEQVKQALWGIGAVARLPAVSLAERFDVILEHSRHYENLVQNRRFDGMRSHLIRYCRDLHGAAELRPQLVRVSSARDVEVVLENYLRRSDCGLPEPGLVTGGATGYSSAAEL